MKVPVAITALALAALSASAADAADITYVGVEEVGGVSADLSITTNGTIGALSTSDIVNYNVLVTAPNFTNDITPQNSFIEQYAETDNLVATSNSITFIGLALRGRRRYLA